MDTIQDVLIYQTQMMRNSSLGPYVPADFSPPQHIVVVNALFYASLGVMLLAAFIAMLIKSWVREFDRGLRGMSIPEQRAKTREFRYLGMEYWKLPEMVAVLPLLIQISLLLFAIGLVLFLSHISKASLGVTAAIFGVGVLFYATTTSISVFITSSPFHSPLSRASSGVYQYVHAYFCHHISDFLSPTMDTTPATALGRARRDVQILLQKSRPYLEKEFVEPIKATTMDEIQLSTAASALQRIHESAPNSQHSEALQWSVWQVAGSTTLRIPPLFALPSWILDRWKHEEYGSGLPPAMVVALVSVSLRVRSKAAIAKDFAIARAVRQRMDYPQVPWAQLVIAVFDRLLLNIYTPHRIKTMKQTRCDDLRSLIRRKALHKEESLWLLSTLSELCSEALLSSEKPYMIDICLTTLFNDAPRWDHLNPPDIVLLDAVVTLAATSCSPDRAYQLNILTNSRQHPWLLLNLRNPDHISKLLEDAPDGCHEQLISLLFLVLYALMRRNSIPLAVQYLTIITAKGDLPLYASALTAIAPSVRDDTLNTFVRLLLASQAQDLASIMNGFMVYGLHTIRELFKIYDLQLGANKNPDPNIFAILLMLSKHPHSEPIEELQNLNLGLVNPWLRLAARIVDQLGIPDGFGVPTGVFHDHRIHNMIAALFLLRYTRGTVTEYTESLLLASFLESREPAISSVALMYYIKTTLSHPNPSAPSHYLSRAVHAVFNLTLPNHQLRMGWAILEIFVNGFENLPVEWRRTFAESFFTMSRQPLARSRGDTETDTPESAFGEILTWEYFHEKEREDKFTDLDYSGLDWMAIAWSLHLSQKSRAKVAVQSRGSTATVITEEFVLQALCKLLEAAPYHQILPIVPKLCEFVQWFDDIGFSDNRVRISARMEEAVRKHEEFQMLHRFRKFHCMWYA